MDLDRQLSTAHHVVLVGGAAMIVEFGADRATRDVDVLVLQGELGEFRRAVGAVAARHGLPEDWVNEAAKGLADILPPDFQDRLSPLPVPLQKLRVSVVGLPEMVALKIVALREQDMEDLEILLPRLSESDRRTVISTMHHVARFRPDWAQKIRYFLEEQGWEVG